MIVFAHLLNDRSGSPRVLASAIDGLSLVGEARLFVGSGCSGVLDEVQIPTTRFWYRRTRYRLLTLLTYLTSQVALLLRLLTARNIPRDAVVYVNTVLPFAAALYGRLTGRAVIYHLHEVSISPPVLRWLLLAIVRRTATHVIYVSEFHRSQLPLSGVPSTVIYNALAPSFLDSALASNYKHRRNGVFRVLMLATLRDYKGVPEFVSLAQRLGGRSDISFELIANDADSAIAHYFSTRTIPANLTIYPRTDKPESHYRNASLVLNLSRPDLCQETFGLTIIEAMAFGVPVIVPPVGGPTEIVRDNKEGLCIDCRDADALAAAVQALADDPAKCLAMSVAGRLKSQSFTRPAFVDRLRPVVASVI